MYASSTESGSLYRGKADADANQYGTIDIAGSGSTVLGNVIHYNLPVRTNTGSSLDGVPLHGSKNVHWTITRPTNSYFTGRRELVDDIAQTVWSALCDNPPLEQCRLVVTGMGGQGKSEICLQVANRVRPWCIYSVVPCSISFTYRLRFWAVFWVDVATVSSAESGFLAIAHRLKVAANTIDEVLQVLANLQRTWLLVLDNADDARVDYQDYFPTGCSGVIIITSRNGECSQYSTRKSVALAGLPEADARDLLLTATKIPPAKYDLYRQDAEAISSYLLQGHPLATIQAGAYIFRGHCSLAEYRNVFHRQRKRLLKFRFDQAKSRYGDVYATFEVSAELIKSLQTDEANDALQLLSILAILNFSRLPLSLFETVWTSSQDVRNREEEVDDWSYAVMWHVEHLPPFLEVDGEDYDSFRLLEAVRLLESYALIVVDVVDDQRYISMHPLTHAWAKERQEAKALKETWLKTACMVAVSTSGSGSSFWLKRQQYLRSHILALLETNIKYCPPTDKDKKIAAVLYLCGDLLDDMRLDNELFDLMEQTFKWLKLDPMKVNEEWLLMYYLSGINMRNYGQTRESVILLEQVVEIRKNMGSETFMPTLLTCQVMLARAYGVENLPKRAIPLLQEVVRIREEKLDEDDAELLGAQHELGSAYLQDDQISAAIKVLEHVVKVRKGCLEEDDNNLLASTHELARGYLIDDQIGRAIELLEQVVKTRDEVLADAHRDRLVSQHVLAMAYNDNGEPEKAIPILEEVVRAERDILVDYHRDRLRSMYRLAVAYVDADQKEKAIPLLVEEIGIRLARWDDDDPELLSSQDQLAFVYNSLNQTEKSIPILEAVIAVRKRTAEDNDKQLLSSLHELGFAFKTEGKIDEAIEILENVVEKRKTIFEETNVSLLVSQFVLATALRDNGQKQRALTILEQVSEVEGRVLEADSSSRMVTQHELGFLYCALDQRDKGIPVLEEVVSIRKRILDKNDTESINSQNELAFAYRAIGQTERAVAIWEEVVKVKEELLDTDDSSLLVALHRVGLGYEANRQIPEAILTLERVVETEARTLERKDENRLISEHELARLYAENGQLERGFSMLKEIVEIRRETLPEDSANRLSSEEVLAVAYWDKDERETGYELMQQVVKVRKRVLKTWNDDRLRTQRILKRWKRTIRGTDDVSSESGSGDDAEETGHGDGKSDDQARSNEVGNEPNQTSEGDEGRRVDADETRNQAAAAEHDDEFEIIHA